MKLRELEALYRFDAFDNAKPPYVSSEDVARLFTEAEKEACLRADLIREVDDPTICVIPISVGEPRFDLDPRIVRVTQATFTPNDPDNPDAEPISLRIVVDRRQLDGIRPLWRTASQPPRELLIERLKATLGSIPDTDGTVNLECFRLPMKALVKDSDEPEIDEPHHRHLVKWVIKRAFERPDAELRNPGGATAADDAFSSYFGLRTDSDQRQASEAVPAYNVAVW